MNLQLSSAQSKISLLAGLLLVILAMGTFILRTAIADRLIAIVYQPNEYDVATKLASADAAIRFAPGMAQTHYQRGLIYLAQAVGDETNERLQAAIASLRMAASLSPEDFRAYVALGQALSRHEEIAEAKKAFQQAQTIAPGHYEPHWAYGNFLLRNNETEAAFAEFKQALALRPIELPLLFDYAWNAYNGDVPAILAALAPPNEAKAQLAGLLVERGKFKEGMMLWHELGQTSPVQMRRNAQAFIGKLSAKQQFGTSYDVWQEAAKIDSPNPNLSEEARAEERQWFTVNPPDAGSSLNNGDFERDLIITTTPPFLFWRLTATKGVSTARDSESYKTGKFSLRFTFDVPNNSSFALLEQAVPVKAATKYRLSFAAKTEDLITLSSPFVEVFDPADIKRLRVAAKPLPIKNNAWGNYTIDLTTSAATEIVVVRVIRTACGDPNCSINGKIWLDDFKLAPLD